MRLMTLAVLLASSSVSLGAETGSFEAALSETRSVVLKTRAAQIAAKQTDMAREIERTAGNVRSLMSEAYRLRRQVDDVRHRARYRDDYTLREAVQRLAWDLRSFYRRVDQETANITRMARWIGYRDPYLRIPARDLYDAAKSLDSEIQRVAEEGRMAADALYRIGLSTEASSLRQQSSDANAATSDLENAARRLWDLVR